MRNPTFERIELVKAAREQVGHETCRAFDRLQRDIAGEAVGNDDIELARD